MNTQNSPAFRPQPRAGFTLIELLIVIAVIGILAAMIFPVLTPINKKKILSRAGTELAELETAITSYQGKLGHYPPDHRAIPCQNQLYYELVGSKLDASGSYKTLDGVAQVAPTALSGLFGVGGFVNATKDGGTDEGQNAQKFLTISQGRSMQVTSTNGAGTFMALGSLLKGPTMLNAADGTQRSLNPWCYVSTGATNNPGSYDLWIDVFVGKTVYRVSNWSKQPLVVP